VPHKDELNHVLAARALLEGGTLEIAPGASPYDRAWGFTYLVAGIFRVAGESLVAGRVPSLLAGAALALALFLWVRSEVGRAGGWVAALLMIFSPVSLMLSQWIRFYTIHALLFFVACVLVYWAFSDAPVARRNRMWMVVGALTCLVLALHLQLLTIVGIAGLGVWVLLVGIPEAFRQVSGPGRRAWLVGGLLALALAAVAVFVLSGSGERLRTMAGAADLWAMGSVDHTRYYHDRLLGQYPTLWTLFPLALLIAASSRWRAALLCASVFGVTFVALSMVAWKVERYIFFALPMFFAVWGIALGTAMPWLADRARTALRAASGRALPPRLESTAVAIALAAVALFAAFGNSASSYALKIMTTDDAEWRAPDAYRGNSDWVAAGTVLAPDLAQADAVLGSYDVTAIYGLGRLDYLLRRVGSTDGDVPDFHVRSKSGVPIVSTPEALDLVMSCHRSGLVFIEEGHYGAEWSVTLDLVRHLEANGERLELPEKWRLIAFRWAAPEVASIGSCDDLLGGAPPR
jgi:hypothetical protein